MPQTITFDHILEALFDITRDANDAQRDALLDAMDRYRAAYPATMRRLQPAAVHLLDAMREGVEYGRDLEPNTTT